MKKKKIVMAAAVISIMASFTAFGGQWQQDAVGWWYQNDDGSYTVNNWQDIDEKSYYFGEDGYMYASAIVPDGNIVDGTGAKVNLDTSSYESIYNYYCLKIQYKAGEYAGEIEFNNEGINGLAEKYSNKVNEMAEIETDGTQKMADFYLNHGLGSYQEYLDWTMKLYDVYMAKAQELYNQYMDAAL